MQNYKVARGTGMRFNEAPARWPGKFQLIAEFIRADADASMRPRRGGRGS